MENKKFVVAASVLGALLCTNAISAMKYSKELKNRENLKAPLLPLDNKDEEQVSATETISVPTLLQRLKKSQPQIFFKGSASWVFRDITQTAKLFSNNNPVSPIRSTDKNQLVLSFHDKKNVPGLKKLYLPGEIETKHRQTIERVIRRHCPDVTVYWRHSKDTAIVM